MSVFELGGFNRKQVTQTFVTGVIAILPLALTLAILRGSSG